MPINQVHLQQHPPGIYFFVSCVATSSRHTKTTYACAFAREAHTGALDTRLRRDCTVLRSYLHDRSVQADLQVSWLASLISMPQKTSFSYSCR
jgi:hypothetical protein